MPNNAAWVAQLVAFHKIHTTSYPPTGALLRSRCRSRPLPGMFRRLRRRPARPRCALAARPRPAPEPLRRLQPLPTDRRRHHLHTCTERFELGAYRNPYGPDLYIISFAGAGIKVDDDVEEDILARAAGVPRPVPPTSFIKKIAYADGSTLERWFTGDGTEFEVVHVGGERCTSPLYQRLRAVGSDGSTTRLGPTDQRHRLERRTSETAATQLAPDRCRSRHALDFFSWKHAPTAEGRRPSQGRYPHVGE